MHRNDALDLLYRLHRAPNEFYAGGEATALRWLAPGITWTVPGDNRIAGSYHGLDEVFGYFGRRRALSGRSSSGCSDETCWSAWTTTWLPLTDGTATVNGSERR